jgi:hypothetical protein
MFNFDALKNAGASAFSLEGVEEARKKQEDEVEESQAGGRAGETGGATTSQTTSLWNAASLVQQTFSLDGVNNMKRQQDEEEEEASALEQGDFVSLPQAQQEILHALREQFPDASNPMLKSMLKAKIKAAKGLGDSDSGGQEELGAKKAVAGEEATKPKEEADELRQRNIVEDAEAKSMAAEVAKRETERHQQLAEQEEVEQTREVLRAKTAKDKAKKEAKQAEEKAKSEAREAQKEAEVAQREAEDDAKRELRGGGEVDDEDGEDDDNEKAVS